MPSECIRPPKRNKWTLFLDVTFLRYSWTPFLVVVLDTIFDPLFYKSFLDVTCGHHLQIPFLDKISYAIIRWPTFFVGNFLF